MQSVGAPRWAIVYVAVVVSLTFSGVGVLASAGGAFGQPGSAGRAEAASPIATLHADGHELQVISLPRRLGVAAAVSVVVHRGGRPLDGARLRVSFSMPGMSGMAGPTRVLRQTGPGVYTSRSTVLTVGRWAATFRVTPRRGPSFSAAYGYRIDG